MEMDPHEDRHEILVHAATGVISRWGTPVDLCHRQSEIAVAIAVHVRPISLGRLGELLFPDRAPADASNTIKVNVCRLRRRLGPNCVVHRDGGYSLGPQSAVDVTQAETFIRSFRPRSGLLDAGEREWMLQIARGLRREPTAAMLACEWHEPVALRAHRLGHDTAMLIARCALERDELPIAAAIARELTYEDSCDEEAWELLIRTQVRLGEIAAARRGFRLFEAALAAELQTRPSPAIWQLIQGDCSAIAI